MPQPTHFTSQTREPVIRYVAPQKYQQGPGIHLLRTTNRRACQIGPKPSSS